MNWLNILLALLYTLVFPGFLFTAVVGLLLTWVDRKVTAIIQSRIGPPWYQPFADIGKLLSKKMVIPRGGRSFGFLVAPILSVAGTTLAAVIVFRAWLGPATGFVGDLIVLVYLLTLPAIALIIGGASSRSPFGAVGASREMSLILTYEIGFLLSIAVVLVKVGSIRFADILAYQAVNGSIAWSVSGFLALVVALFCIQAKQGLLPFDISEAETELIGGPLAEYSGVGLALFKLSRAMLFLVLPVFIVLLFLGPVLLTWSSILWFIVKLLVVLTVAIVVKATHARLRLDQALSLFWRRLAVLGAASVVLALVGL